MSGWQVTDVELDQDDVRHETAEILTLAVNTAEPKFRPVTVTDDRPDMGLLTELADIVGVSNVKLCQNVPAVAATVRCCDS